MPRGLTFAAFAQAVDEQLWLLGVEPAFALDHRGARWSCAPYVAELQPFDSVRARVVLSAHGRACFASKPGLMTAAGAATLARAVGMLFGGRSVTGAATVTVRRAGTARHVAAEVVMVSAKRADSLCRSTHRGSAW
jgi:hypothetical protein